MASLQVRGAAPCMQRYILCNLRNSFFSSVVAARMVTVVMPSSKREAPSPGLGPTTPSSSSSSCSGAPARTASPSESGSSSPAWSGSPTRPRSPKAVDTLVLSLCNKFPPGTLQSALPLALAWQAPESSCAPACRAVRKKTAQDPRNDILSPRVVSGDIQVCLDVQA